LKFGRSGEHLSPEKGSEGTVKIVSNVKEPAAGGLRKRPILHLWQPACEQQSKSKKLCLQKEKTSVMIFLLELNFFFIIEKLKHFFLLSQQNNNGFLIGL
jgi:hypothetical protein